MKRYLFLLLFSVFALCVNAQVKDSVKIYDPHANASADIKEAVKKASAQHKNVLLQIGGNWCIWCIRFHNLTTTDPDLSKYLSDNYEVRHINYSPENKNLDVLASLGNPQRFGFPVFVVLDGNGKVIHIQDSGLLEEGKGHSKAKVMEFLKGWSAKAIDPKSYTKAE